MKKMLALIISLTMIISCFSGITIVSSEETVVLQGKGTEGSPYLISKPAEFEAVFGKTATLDYHAMNKTETGAKREIVYFEQTANFDLVNYTPKKQRIVCNYNGNGKTINIKSYVNSNVGEQGLFSGVGSGGVVRDLTVKGVVDGSGTSYVAGIVGYLNGGSVINCVNEATVSGNAYVGGIVGCAQGGTIKNCVNRKDPSKNEDSTNEVLITATSNSAGGILGYSSGNTVKNIINCANYGSVTCTSSKVSNGSTVGGILGYCAGVTVIEKSFNAGEVISPNGAAGAFVGSNKPDNSKDGVEATIAINDCFNTGKINGKITGALIIGTYTTPTSTATTYAVPFSLTANKVYDLSNSSLPVVPDNLPSGNTVDNVLVLGANGVTSETIVNAYLGNSLYTIVPDSDFEYPNFRYSEDDGVEVTFDSALGGIFKSGVEVTEPEEPETPDEPETPVEPEEPEEPETLIKPEEPVNPEVIIEAEDMLLVETKFERNGTEYTIKTEKIDNDKASGGKYVKLSSGTTNATAPKITEQANILADFAIKETGVYKLKIRYCAPSTGDQMFVWCGTDDYLNQAFDCKMTDFEWFEFGTLLLEGGTTLPLRIVFRESYFMIDAVMLEKCDNFENVKADYAPRTYKGGVVEYPQLLTSEDIGTLPKFEDGDRVVFIGDSITHGTSGGYYHKLLLNYYNLRYPDATFVTVNKGINGDKSSGALGRIYHDIYDEKDVAKGAYNKVVIMLGTNDMIKSDYYAAAYLESGIEEKRQGNFDTYKTNMEKLVNKLLEDENIEQIILQTPPMPDEYLLRTNNRYYDFNNAIRRAASILYELSQKYDKVDFVDVNTPMTLVELFNLEDAANEANFSFVPDRLHPSEAGHYIMLYSMLKAQGETGEIATVDIDAPSSVINTNNADVAGLTYSENGLSYEYTPKALPLGADANYREAEGYFPVTEELNREIIRVKGLPKGNYDIKADGKLLITVTADDLEKGVNIADLENNPGQQIALNILSIVSNRLKMEDSLRNIISTEAFRVVNGTSALKTKESKGETITLAELEAAAKALAVKYETQGNTTNLNEINEYLANKPNEPQLVDAIYRFADAAVERSKTVKFTVSIEKTENAAEGIAEVKYVKQELDKNTLVMKTKTLTEGISIDRISFADATGELTAAPAGDAEITAKVTVSNNKVNAEKVTLWAAAYKNGNQISVAQKAVTLGIGVSEEVIIPLSIKGGCDELKAGLWNSFTSLSPVTKTAVYPVVETEISDIYVDGFKLDGFSPDKYEYTYYIHKYQTLPSFVTAVSKNSNVQIEVTQAETARGTATVKAGEKTYSITFVPGELPVLSAIYLDGKLMDYYHTEDKKTKTFTPYEYYCTHQYTAAEGLPTEITVEAPEGISYEMKDEIATKGKLTINVSTSYGWVRTYTIYFEQTK